MTNIPTPIEVLGNFQFVRALPVPKLETLPTGLEYTAIAIMADVLYKHVLNCTTDVWEWQEIASGTISNSELVAIQSLIADESIRAQMAESSIATGLLNEVNRAETIESGLRADLDALTLTVSALSDFVHGSANLAPIWNTITDLGTLTGVINLQLSATDPEGQPLTYIVTGGTLPPNVALSSAGLLSGSIAAANAISYSFNVVAGDGVNNVSRTFTISPVGNLSPVWTTVTDLGSLTGAINLQLVATDPEGQPLAYSVTSGTLPPNVTLSSTGLLSGTIAVDNAVVYSFNIEVTDGVNVASRTFTIQSTDNLAPVWTTVTDLGSLTGIINLQLVATDPEGQPLAYSVTSGTLPPNVTLSSTGLLSGTVPLDNAISYSFNIEVTDGVYAVSRTFTIQSTDNLAPVWTTVTDLGQLNGIVELQLVATDPEGQPLAYTVTGGALPPEFTLSAEGLLTGTLPAVNTIGYSFNVEVTDGVHTVSRVFAISAGVNTPPSWITSSSLGAIEGNISLQLLASDGESQPLTYTVIDGALPWEFTLSTGGLLVGTLPIANIVEYNFTVSVSDGVNAVDRAFVIVATEVYDAGIIGLTPSATLPDVLYADTVDLTEIV